MSMEKSKKFVWISDSPYSSVLQNTGIRKLKYVRGLSSRILYVG